MKTQWQWLQEGRIPNDNARWEVGEELNKIFCTCAYGSNYCYCHERYTHEPKMMKRCKKPFLIFIRTEIAGYDYKQSKKEVLLNN